MSSKNEIGGSVECLEGMYSKQEREIGVVSKKPKWKSLLGGFLLLLAVLLSIVFALDFNSTAHVLLMCNPFSAFFQLCAIVGAMSALLKKVWIISVLGGIFGLFLGGPYALASGVSAIGLIIILLASDEFKSE